VSNHSKKARAARNAQERAEELSTDIRFAHPI
jgi:hypothetical protein